MQIKNLIISFIAILTFAISLFGAFKLAEPPSEEFLRNERLGSAPISLEIDGLIKEIKNTDDNTGENFIIKTDSKDYYSWGGNIRAYFSITNVSGKDQSIKIVFSASEKVDVEEIQRFNKNDVKKDTTVVTATTTYKDRVVETIWDSLFKSFPIFDVSISRKDMGSTKLKAMATDSLLSGETRFYRAKIRPDKEIQGDEWFIEVFGSNKDYGHLDPNNWVAEEDFEYTPNGLAGSNGGTGWGGAWVESGGVGHIVTDQYYSGASALKTNDASTAMYATRQLASSITDGTIYIAMRKSVNNVDNWVTFDLRDNASNIRGRIKLDDNGKIILLYDANSWLDIDDYVANQWYVIAIEFDTTIGSFGEYRARVHDGNSWGSWTASVSMRTSTSGAIYYVTMNANNNSPAISTWWDTITPTDPTPAPAVAEEPGQVINWGF